MLASWLWTTVFGSRVATIAVTGSEYSLLKARADANNADKIRFLGDNSLPRGMGEPGMWEVEMNEGAVRRET
jgi:hypothetical protein